MKKIAATTIMIGNINTLFFTIPLQVRRLSPLLTKNSFARVIVQIASVAYWIFCNPHDNQVRNHTTLV